MALLLWAGRSRRSCAARKPPRTYCRIRARSGGIRSKRPSAQWTTRRRKQVGLSIGGGLGPVRVRVGTRSSGVGFGPVSASTGYGRRRRSSSSDGAGWAAIVALALAVLVVVWPYLLGTWLAVKLGADNPSTARAVVGWIFEGAYLALLVLGGVGMLMQERSGRRQAQEAAARARQREHAATIEQLEKAALWRVSPPRLRPLPVDVSGTPDEKLICQLDDVQLLQPRGSADNKLPTVVDQGTVLVTTRRVLFHGQSKSATWALDKLLSARRDGRSGLLLPVASRQAVFGLDPGTTDRLVLLWSLVAWAGGQRAGADRDYSRALGVIAQHLQLPAPTEVTRR